MEVLHLLSELIGRLVISKAGRDKGKPFVILKVLNDKFLMVADGDLRKVDDPKMKNVRHVQFTNMVIPEIAEAISNGENLENHRVRKLIRSLWTNYQENYGKEGPFNE